MPTPSTPFYRSLLLAAACALLLAAACAEPAEDARAAWLRDTLVTDNQAQLERSPELVAQKFALMASSPYRYMRGTAGVFWRDLLNPSPIYGAWIPMDVTGAATLLVGDPHPENVGTFRAADDQLVLAFNDYDSASWGPFTGDVQRLVLGWQVAWLQAEPTADGPTLDTFAIAVFEGYATRVAERASGAPVERVLESDVAGEIVADLFRRSRRDGDASEALLEVVETSDSGRRLRRGDIEAPVAAWFEDTLVDVTPAERRMVEAVIRGAEVPRDPIAALPEAGPVLDVVRRLGTGVSSYALPRYYALVEGPTDAPDDDRLLEMKETLDPPPIGPLVRYPEVPQTHHAARIVWAQDALNPGPRLDPWAGASLQGAMSLRIRERTSYQKGFDVVRLQERFQDGRWTVDDALRFAALTGWLLAEAHANSPPLAGREGFDVGALQRSLQADDAERRLLQWADEARALLLDDYARFVELLQVHGPTLGYQSSNRRSR
jgi:uncharacterized protein (DUF2252 family)